MSTGSEGEAATVGAAAPTGNMKASITEAILDTAAAAASTSGGLVATKAGIVPARRPAALAATTARAANRTCKGEGVPHPTLLLKL